MLDIGGTISCRIYQPYPGVFQIYILAKELGIEPGEAFISNYRFMKPYRNPEYVENNWYIRLYASCSSKRNRNKRKFRMMEKIPESVLLDSVFYNEAVKVEVEEKWFTQDIKASILLPIIKERSKISNSLIYVDEYWKT